MLHLLIVRKTLSNPILCRLCTGIRNEAHRLPSMQGRYPHSSQIEEQSLALMAMPGRDSGCMIFIKQYSFCKPGTRHGPMDWMNRYPVSSMAIARARISGLQFCAQHLAQMRRSLIRITRIALHYDI